MMLFNWCWSSKSTSANVLNNGCVDSDSHWFSNFSLAAMFVFRAQSLMENYVRALVFNV